MKNFIILAISCLFPVLLLAQESENKVRVEISGFVRNDVIYNTRQVVSARSESQFLLAPAPVVLDENGQDINDSPNFNIIGFNSRLRVKAWGPDALGAKTSGMIEGDFFGTNGTTKFNFRLRHAFVTLDWGSAKLLAGQFWHPDFVTSCYPATVSFGAGVPFNPFARVPQLRFTYNISKSLSVFAAIMSQGHFIGKSPAQSAQNAAIPESHIQLAYKTEAFLFGLGFNYQVLKPALSNSITTPTQSTTIYKTDEKVSSYSVLAFMKFKTKPITVKLYGIYGQNDDNLVMMGGYAELQSSYLTPEQIEIGHISYTPYNVLTGWLDLHTNGAKTQFGLFAAISQNLGADKKVDIASFTGRWGNVNRMMRISPRCTYMTGKIKLGLEVEYSIAEYAQGNPSGTTQEEIMGINDKGKVTSYKSADNLKFLASVSYIF